GYFEAKHSGRLGVNNEFELGCLHYRQVGRLAALENATSVQTDLTIGIRKIGSIAHQTTGQGEFSSAIGRRYCVSGRQIDQLSAPDLKEGVAPNIERVRPLASEARKGRVYLVAVASVENLDLESAGASSSCHLP